MTKQDLLNNGYKKFKPATFDCDKVSAKYQKVVGNKDYFITWDEWDFSEYADENHTDLKEPRFEGHVQLMHKETGNYLNLEFLAGWELDEAEKFIKQLFETGWFEEYE